MILLKLENSTMRRFSVNFHFRKNKNNFFVINIMIYYENAERKNVEKINVERKKFERKRRSYNMSKLLRYRS